MGYSIRTLFQHTLSALLLMFLNQTLCGQSDFISIDVINEQQIHIGNELGIEINLITKNTTKDRSYTLTSNGLVQLSTQAMNENTRLHIELTEEVYQRGRDSLVNNIWVDTQWLAGLYLLNNWNDIFPNKEETNKRSTFDKAVKKFIERIDKRLRNERNKSYLRSYKRNVKRYIGQIGLYDDLWAAQKGEKNDYWDDFQPINILKVIEGDTALEYGVHSGFMLDVGLTMFKSGLGDVWSKNAGSSTFAGWQIDVSFARKIVGSLYLGNDIYFGLYGFVSFERYVHGLDNEENNLFVSQENVVNATDNFHRITTDEDVELSFNHVSFGAFIDLYKFKWFFLDVGGGWNFYSSSNVTFKKEDSDDNPITHLESGLQLSENSFSDVFDQDNDIYGLIRFGYRNLGKSKKGKPAGINAFISAKFGSRNITPNNDYPIFQQTTNPDNTTSFARTPTSNESSSFYAIKIGLGFTF